MKMNFNWRILVTLALFHVNGIKCNGCVGSKMLRKGGLTCQDKKIIIDEHNRLRQQIALGRVRGQPGASNMVELVWDDELAYTAQKWANLCSENHDVSRHVQRFAVGQNLAKSWSTGWPSSYADTQPDFIRQINNWFNEVQSYRMNGINSGTGHYTQVVWGSTWAVGCGYTYYWDPRRGYTKNYVCNYGPSGNILGHQPYASGRQSCLRFGMSNSKSHSGLCSIDSYYPLGETCAYYGYY